MSRASSICSVAAIVMSLHRTASGADPQELIDAAKRNDGAAVRSLLQERVSANVAQADGTTSLHWAAHHGNAESVDLLIGSGAEVDKTNRYGITPLWLAASLGHLEVAERLVKAGADAKTTRAENGETVLMMAARGGHTAVVKLLLAHGADVNARERLREQTALMWAAAEQHPDTVQALVAAGADLKARSKTGITPLMFAVRAGDIDSTKRLLSAGADLGETAPDGTTILVLAILNARYELADMLLNTGADPNVDDPNGRPLHVLTWIRRAEHPGNEILPRTPSGGLDTIDFAKSLLAHGARINERIDWKDPGQRGIRTPDHLAIGTQSSTTLIGATPFYIAALNCDVPFMKFLAENGADARIATIQNITPLLAAAGVGWQGGAPGTPEEALDAVKFAYELGNDPKAFVDFGTYTRGRPVWDGASALHGAVIRGSKPVAEWLIEKGVPLDHQVKTGETALNWAEGNWVTPVYSVAPELAKLLREKMAQQGLPVPPQVAPSVGIPKGERDIGVVDAREAR